MYIGVPVEPIPYIFPRDALEGTCVDLMKTLVNLKLPSALDLSVHGYIFRNQHEHLRLIRRMFVGYFSFKYIVSGSKVMI